MIYTEQTIMNILNLDYVKKVLISQNHEITLLCKA